MFFYRGGGGGLVCSLKGAIAGGRLCAFKALYLPMK